MTYKELFYFTGQCLSLDEHPEFRETIVQKIEDKDIPWEKFVQLCSDHLIIPVVYLRFKTHALLSFLPEELAQTLAAIYELNCTRNAKILLQIEQITTVLFPENIIPVYLKGTGNLLDGLYSDPGERMIGDIDLLVPEDDYFRAAASIEKMGYQHSSKIYVDVSRSKHYPRLYRKGLVDVEIHRMPVEKKYAKSFNSLLVFSKKMPVEGRPGLHVPSNAHKLIHTFIHSQLNDNGHAYKQVSFRDLFDLYLLSKRMDVSTLARQTRYSKKAVAWLVFGQRVLGLPGRFYPLETREAKWFCLRYDLALTYVKTYNAYTFLKKLIYLLFVRYAWGLFKAAFQKRHRDSFYRRLKDPDWYKAHLISYKEYF